VEGHEARIKHDYQVAAFMTAHILNAIRGAVGAKGDPVTVDGLLKGMFRRTRPKASSQADEDEWA
jgi:hypothetical protein